MVTSKANSTTVRVDVALDGGSFDSANVSFSPALADETFSDEDLPVLLSGLTSGVDYNMTFVFGVGGSTNCGDDGNKYSSPIVVEYEPGKNNNTYNNKDPKIEMSRPTRPLIIQLGRRGIPQMVTGKFAGSAYLLFVFPRLKHWKCNNIAKKIYFSKNRQN